MRDRFNNYTITRPRLRKTAGWALVAIGFVGIIAPIIPGAPILYIGLEILGLRIVFTDKVKQLFIKRTKIPKIPEIIPTEKTS